MDVNHGKGEIDAAEELINYYPEATILLPEQLRNQIRRRLAVHHRYPDAWM
jgi:hypothetical protein